jgi:hypothetical protein
MQQKKMKKKLPVLIRLSALFRLSSVPLLALIQLLVCWSLFGHGDKPPHFSNSFIILPTTTFTSSPAALAFSSALAASTSSSSRMFESTSTPTPTLPQYLESKQVDQELSNIICSTAIACIQISQKLQTLPIANYVTSKSPSEESNHAINVQGEVQKEMDVIANDIFINNVKDTVVVMTSEEEEDIITGGLWDQYYTKTRELNEDGIESDIDIDIHQRSTKTGYGYEIAFDPLDGSSNLDVNVPTG